MVEVAVAVAVVVERDRDCYGIVTIGRMSESRSRLDRDPKGRR